MHIADAELIRRVVDGDALAERVLFDRHIDAVFAVAFRLCGDRDAAADYSQETFIKVFRTVHQLRTPASFPGWLRTVVASVTLSGEKKRARFRGSIEPDSLIDERNVSHAAFDLNTTIARGLDNMQESLRTVFLMYDVEGYTHDEIAQLLGIAVGTSRWRLAEARALLRKLLPDCKEEAS